MFKVSAPVQKKKEWSKVLSENGWNHQSYRSWAETEGMGAMNSNAGGSWGGGLIASSTFASTSALISAALGAKQNWKKKIKKDKWSTNFQLMQQSQSSSS